MKITVSNLGVLRHAEFTLGDFTIICGRNNTGKTYATYATYGFLDYWRNGHEIDFESNYTGQLLAKGTTTISLPDVAPLAATYLEDGCTRYSGFLDQVFAAKERTFAESTFSVELLSAPNNYLDREVDITLGSMEKNILRITKDSGSSDLIAALLIKKDEEPPPRSMINEMFGNAIKEVLFGRVFPKPFIASAERTGSAIFQKELDFTRNRIIELLGEKSGKLHPLVLLGKFVGDYPVPVRKNVDFIRDLPLIANKQSEIAKRFPDLLDSFADIIGGEYSVTKDGEIQFIPAANKRVKLSMVESSSAVRSLLDIGFYLRHIAEPGHLLMVDEPELNLHPENQRRVARLFARLVNLGIKVFITTHSDYLVKELNTLIMLNGDSPHLKRIAEREGYDEGELVAADKIKVYVAEPARIKLPGAKRPTKSLTLLPVDINQESGIDARSFDDTIETMNRIQDEIVWGAE
jgi:hypothetical protein